jgi:hypothetical protein
LVHFHAVADIRDRCSHISGLLVKAWHAFGP